MTGTEKYRCRPLARTPGTRTCRWQLLERLRNGNGKVVPWYEGIGGMEVWLLATKWEGEASFVSSALGKRAQVLIG
jgi:hypothetical protein